MTRKDYVRIAAAINDAYRTACYLSSDPMPILTGVTVAEREIARCLRADNPNFDGDRFKAACREGLSLNGDVVLGIAA